MGWPLSARRYAFLSLGGAIPTDMVPPPPDWLCARSLRISSAQIACLEHGCHDRRPAIAQRAPHCPVPFPALCARCVLVLLRCAGRVCASR